MLALPEVHGGLGRLAASHHHLPTPHQIILRIYRNIIRDTDISAPLLLKRRCDRRCVSPAPETPGCASIMCVCGKYFEAAQPEPARAS
jgi:hypothetical protein